MVIQELKPTQAAERAARTGTDPRAAQPHRPNAPSGSTSMLPYLDHVDDVLDRFFAVSRRRAERMAPRYEQLWAALQDATAGGKRFRPRLVWTSYECLGGSDPGTAAHVGAAFELLHTALMVHDDVIDRDFVRRGRPNIPGRYRQAAREAGLSDAEADHRGMSVAVVAGGAVQRLQTDRPEPGRPCRPFQTAGNPG